MQSEKKKKKFAKLHRQDNGKLSADTGFHYKMYKDGRNWVAAGLSALALAGVITFSNVVTVNADTTPATTQAATSTSTVTVDSSQLNSAVSAASAAGVTATQGSTETISANTVAEGEAAISSAYESQAASIAAATSQYAAESTADSDTNASNAASYAAESDSVDSTNASNAASYSAALSAYTISEAAFESADAAWQVKEAAYDSAEAVYSSQVAEQQNISETLTNDTIPIGVSDADTLLPHGQSAVIAPNKDATAKVTITSGDITLNNVAVTGDYANDWNNTSLSMFGVEADQSPYDTTFSGEQLWQTMVDSSSSVYTVKFKANQGTVKFTVAYTGSATIDGQPVTLVREFTLHDTTGGVGFGYNQANGWLGSPDQSDYFAIASNAYGGVIAEGGTTVDVDEYFLDANGNKINMDGKVYLSIGSLSINNNNDDGTGMAETAIINSGVKTAYLSSDTLLGEGQINGQTAFSYNFHAAVAHSDQQVSDQNGAKGFEKLEVMLDPSGTDVSYTLTNTTRDSSGNVTVTPSVDWWSALSGTQIMGWVPTPPDGPKPPAEPKAPVKPTPAAIVPGPKTPEVVTPTPVSVTYNYLQMVVPAGNPTKVADNEGTTVLAGQTTTQHISQYTGVSQDLTNFYLGDALVYTTDGRLPVSYDTKKWTVTTDNGTDVTSQGVFSEVDATIDGTKVHEVIWTPTYASKLTDNTTYTLNTETTALQDGVADTETDIGVSSFGLTGKHNYNEYIPNPTKNWVKDGVVTNSQIYLSGDSATADISVKLPDPSTLTEKINNVQLTDNYSDFADKVDFESITMLEGTTDVTDEYNFSNDKDGYEVATLKDPSKADDQTVTMHITFKIHSDVADGTVLNNKGSVTVNTDTEPVPDRTITVWNYTPHKDVELGTVSGDTNNSADGDTVTKGQELTFPLSDPSDIPANRTDAITSLKYTDTLDSKLTYDGFKAWIADTNGKLTDVTTDFTESYDSTTGTYSFVANDALLSLYADPSQATPVPIIDLFATPNADGVTIPNTSALYINDHQVTSNTVTIITPTPTPTKQDENLNGTDINGDSELEGSKKQFTITMNNAAEKGVQVTDDEIAKGFGFYDDYDENALTVDPSTATYTDANGKAVTGITATAYDSLSAAPASVQAWFAANNITTNGKFIWFSVDDPDSFYKSYVETGDNVSVKFLATVNAGFSGDYSNTAYTNVFGNAYTTNTVTNNVPKIDVKKDVVKSVDNTKSLDGDEIELGDTFDYELENYTIPEGTGTALTEYGFSDDYDQEHDEYNGNYIVLLNTDVTLSDGTVLTKGTDVTKYTTQTIDQANGAIKIEFTQDFIKQLDFSKTAFGASAYVQINRIKSGTVYNKFIGTINNVTFTSNTVKTTTPEPATPTPDKPTPAATTPEPSTPAPAAVTPVSVDTPAPQTDELPQTGESNDGEMLALGGLVGLIAAFGALGTRRKKRYGI